PDEPIVTPGDDSGTDEPSNPDDDKISKDKVAEAVEEVIEVITQLFNLLIQSIRSIFERLFRP
ncbi:MAG: hypothetical protein IJ535_02560, partial [Pseudobutyrivibrio sp.]|uniref:hypothetical protein n=1 Tax=Pseudobutyrivibrio sp. TaxID=2014367 RepID=UPI0025F8E15B